MLIHNIPHWTSFLFTHQSLDSNSCHIYWYWINTWKKKTQLLSFFKTLRRPQKQMTYWSLSKRRFKHYCWDSKRHAPHHLDGISCMLLLIVGLSNLVHHPGTVTQSCIAFGKLITPLASVLKTNKAPISCVVKNWEWYLVYCKFLVTVSYYYKCTKKVKQK